VLIAQREAARALRLLDGLLALARTQGRLGSELELLVLCALAAQVQGHPEQAVHLLHQALVLGQPAGYLRLFVDAGPALLPVLQRVQDTWPGSPEAAYAHQLLVLLEGAPPGRTDTWALPSASNRSLVPLLEPLSPRERKVLRLLAAGLSNPEIAAELVVSLSTVKTQVSSIYRKLNVHTRKAAITTARSWRLL
jgi:LuxR family maltose regulon positive regulatory protein